MEKGRFRWKAAVGLHDIQISEFHFVQSMKHDGWLSNFIVDVQCCIWKAKENGNTNLYLVNLQL